MVDREDRSGVADPQQPDDLPMDERPCIEVNLSREFRQMTVAEYHEVQTLWRDQPLWARRVPPVQDLTTTPGHHDVRISHIRAYEVQMWRLLGLDPPESSEVGS